MPVEVKVPSVGESITEGTIARWLRKDGDFVRTGEPVFELETEKATGEVPAPASGRLTIQAKEGAKVAVGSVVATVDETAAPPRGERAPAAPVKASKPAPEAEDTPPLSPAARQLVADENVDVSTLTGTGRGGRIIKEDVLNVLQQRQDGVPASKPAAARETRQRMSAIRQRIAERLVSAQHSAAILTTFNEADLSAVLALRAKHKEAFQKKHGVGLGFMSFFVKAAVEALQAVPEANAFIENDEIVYHNYCNIGVAVSTDKGLMVPVVRDAERLSFAEIERAIAELAQKARDGKIAIGDLQGGTFTITNGGVFGSLLSTPLLNPPQSTILGMHAIQKRPVVVDAQIVIRPMMYLAVSYDHRLLDGRQAVGFLLRIKECIEQPERMLLEV